MAMFRGNKIHAFGLDISDSSIKVAQLALTKKNQIHTAVFADVPLLEKTITNHMIVNPERLAGNILKAYNSARSIDTKFVIPSVPEAKSFVRTVQIPRMDEKEISG